MTLSRLFCFVIPVVAGFSVAQAEEEEVGSPPEPVWEYETAPHLPLTLVLDNRDRPLLYVAQKGGGLLILEDAGDRAIRIAEMPVEEFGDLDVNDIAQRGDHLYLALGGFFAPTGTHPAGLAIVDVSRPKTPRVTAIWTSDEKLKGVSAVTLDGRYVYLSAMSAGVIVLETPSPDEIAHVSTFQPDIHFPRQNPNRVQHPNAHGSVLKGNHLFVAYDAGGIRVLDVSDKRQLKEIGRYSNEAMRHKQEAYNNLVIDGDTAYCAIDYAGMEILDISNPKAIRQIGWWNPWKGETLGNLWLNSPGHTNELALDSGKRLVYLSAGDSEVLVVSVADPKAPRLAGQFGEPKNKRATWGLHKSGDRIYLTYIRAVMPFQSQWAGIRAVDIR